MGIVQRDGVRIMIISYIGLILGYINKAVLFVWFLTTEQIGLLSLLVSVGFLFAQLSNLGMSNNVWRFFPFFRNKEKNHFGFFQLTMLVNLIGMLFFLIVAIIFKDPICSLYEKRSTLFVDYYYWILPIGIAYTLFLTLDNYLRSLFKNIVSVIATEILVRLVVTFAIILFVLDVIDFFTLMALHSLSFMVPTIVLLAQLSRNKELKWRMSQIAISKRLKRIMFSYSAFSYLNYIGILVVISLDTLMIASMVGLSETGVFSTVVYILSALLIPYKSLMRISSPLVAKFWKDRDMKQMHELYIKTSSVSLIIGFFMFLLFWVNRVEFFYFLPKEFAVGANVFLILMIGRMVDMYCGINGIIFVTSKKYRYDLLFTIILLLTVVILNLFLIPIYGIYGAAFSTTCAYILYNIGRMLFVYLAYGIHPLQLSQLRIVVVFVISLFILEQMPLFFGEELISILIKSTLTVLLFGLPIYLLKLDQDVVDYINKVGKIIRAKIAR